MPKVELTVRQVLQLGVVVAIAVMVKQFYSAAAVDQLKFILAPTVGLVTLLTGVEFHWEHGIGFVNVLHNVFVIKSCAGLNFMVTVYLMTGFARGTKDSPSAFHTILGSIWFAYIITLFANAARIIVTIWSNPNGWEMLSVGPEMAHRIEGIFVYFVWLCIGFGALCLQRDPQQRPVKLTFITPLFWYLVVTIAVPIIHSGSVGATAENWQHYLSVMLVAICLWSTVELLLRLMRSAKLTSVHSAEIQG